LKTNAPTIEHPSGENESPKPRIIIEPTSHWTIANLGELWNYRTLLYLMVVRDLKTQYTQTILGPAWSILRPLATMIIFTIVFSMLLRIGSEGTPFTIFVYTALTAWTFFSSALGGVSNSLAAGMGLISKVYFPRIILPLSVLLSKLVDFFIAMILLVVMMVWYRIVPNALIIYLPLLILMAMGAALGLGMWVAVTSVQYRDIGYLLNIITMALMYVSPVFYPASLIPERYLTIYALNPMVGIIEGFRAAILSTNPMPWDFIGIGAITTIILLVSGFLVFQRLESIIVDVS
jgi:lipopolysaccharide transport system permease protein